MSAGSALDNLAPLPAPVAHRADVGELHGTLQQGVAPIRKAHSATLDRLGAVLGFACAVHCIVVPLALGVLPALGLEFLADEGIDHTIVAVASACAVLAAWIGWRAHRDRRIVLSFAGAVALLASAHLIGEHDLGARMLSVAGGVALAVTHLWNTRSSRSCAVPSHNHDAH